MPPLPEELMMRFVRGDTVAFGRLVEMLKPQLVEYARHMLGDRETAEDLVQETFLRVLRARESYQQTAKVSTWIHTILTNLCYDELRKQRRQVSLERLLGHPPTADDQLASLAPERKDGRAGPDVQAERKELSAIADEVMQSLSPEHRDVIHLRIHEGLGNAEAADRLGCSVGTAKSRMHYALRYLREGLLRRI